MRTRFTILFLYICTVSFGQSLKVEIDNIYNFKPAKMTDIEQEKQFATLDKFWNKIKEDTTLYLQSLRNELNAPNHNPYFYYDGTGLLLSLSKTKPDKTLAATSIAKCDIDDISQELYFTTLNKLSNDGIDVSSAALKILTDPNFSFFIPQHALNFNQGYCLTWLLLPLDPILYSDSLITAFKKADPSAQNSIITTFWFAFTCKGDSLIRSAMNDKTIKKDVRDYAKKIMGYTNLTKDQNEYIKTLGANELKTIRAESLKRFSDEAIEELDMTTRVLRRDGKCR